MALNGPLSANWGKGKKKGGGEGLGFAYTPWLTSLPFMACSLPVGPEVEV